MDMTTRTLEFRDANPEVSTDLTAVLALFNQRGEVYRLLAAGTVLGEANFETSLTPALGCYTREGDSEIVVVFADGYYTLTTTDPVSLSDKTALVFDSAISCLGGFASAATGPWGLKSNDAPDTFYHYDMSQAGLENEIHTALGKTWTKLAVLDTHHPDIALFDGDETFYFVGPDGVETRPSFALPSSLGAITVKGLLAIRDWLVVNDDNARLIVFSLDGLVVDLIDLSALELAENDPYLLAFTHDGELAVLYGQSCIKVKIAELFGQGGGGGGGGGGLPSGGVEHDMIVKNSAVEGDASWYHHIDMFVQVADPVDTGQAVVKDTWINPSDPSRYDVLDLTSEGGDYIVGPFDPEVLLIVGGVDTVTLNFDAAGGLAGVVKKIFNKSLTPVRVAGGGADADKYRLFLGWPYALDEECSFYLYPGEDVTLISYWFDMG